jgi:hypothetical protein
MNPMYSNALGSLAAGMAGGGQMAGGEGMGEEMEQIPCPLCGGTGMVTEEMLTGEGQMLPARLASRQPMMGARVGGPMQMPPMSGGMPMS